MSQVQRGFVLKPDGFWYAPPIDPADDLDYKITGSFLDAGDTIKSSPAPVYTVTPPAQLTVHDAALADAGTSLVFWLKSGSSGITYTVTASLVTTAGRHFERSFKIVCQQR